MNISELDDAMKARITDKVIRVISNSHTHPEKKIVLETKDRLNFACPYCGDSTQSTRKKRGNLYWNDLYFHCYNCSVHKPLNIFLNDYGLSFSGDDQINIINYISDNKRTFNRQESLDFYLFDKINQLSLTFDELSVGFNIYPINQSSNRIFPYLKSRLLHSNLNKFAYDHRRKELYIFNLSPEGKIIGLQIRKIDSTSNGPKYNTWNLSRIYDRLNIKISEDEDTINSLDKISMTFGIMSVDFSRDFFVFEGPIDSFFMTNSIGLTGVKKQILEFNDIPTVNYFFDNDKEGKIKMIDKLKAGQSVFMWDKFTSDFKLPSKGIKDLNDLVKYEYKNRIGCLAKIRSYFTNDKLDIIYV